MKAALLGLAFVLTSAGSPHSIQRQRHDHTIYIVHGSREQLARFDAEVASSWQGGVLLRKDESKGEYHYWAYGERTARQAREFMFGSMGFGLKLDIEAYEEKQSFPAERAELDAIAGRCGFGTDPFLITPRRELRVAPKLPVSQKSIDCARSAIKASTILRSLPLIFVGSVSAPERGG